ncbi:MAG TPA: disulfide bond formation protein B [Gammaproteobacteria bacterium]|nr:disulfide bond formation protein B [Gammaproteobacteria bacterium]
MNKFSHRAMFLSAFIITASMLSITFYLQNYDGFVPCPLCILQRMTLGILSIIFFFGGVLPIKKMGNIFLSVSASLVTLIGMILSGRQVWLQHLPPDKNADCGVSLQYLLNVLPFDQVISKIFQGTAECSQKGWEFLHLSLAEWSLICFVGLFIFCVFIIFYRRLSPLL